MKFNKIISKITKIMFPPIHTMVMLLADVGGGRPEVWASG